MNELERAANALLERPIPPPTPLEELERRAHQYRRRRAVRWVSAAAMVVLITSAVSVSLLTDRSTTVKAGPVGRSNVDSGEPWRSLRRPLHDLPAVTPGSRCPTSTLQQIDATHRLAGDGPVYPWTLTDDSTHRLERQGEQLIAKVVWLVDSSYRGPVLIRGRQLDYIGDISFGRATRPESELHLDAKRGANASSVGVPEGWLDFPSETAVRQPGCYGYQIDGTNFSTIVVFNATLDPGDGNRQTGPSVVVGSGSDGEMTWELVTYSSDAGLCLDIRVALGPGSSGRGGGGCGFDTTGRVIGGVLSRSPAHQFVHGFIRKDVVKIRVNLSDGESFTLDPISAPDFDINFFATPVPQDADGAFLVAIDAGGKEIGEWKAEQPVDRPR